MDFIQYMDLVQRAFDVMKRAIVSVAAPILSKFGRIEKVRIPRKVVLSRYNTPRDAVRALQRLSRYARSRPELIRADRVPRHIRWNAQLAKAQLQEWGHGVLGGAS
jgi:hypothetical protein